MNTEIFTIRKRLKSKLDPMRYEHSLSVSFTAMSLAMRYNCDLNKAELAGLLHDCAKRYNDSTIIAKCRQKGIPLSEDELQAPATIHAKLGAWMAANKYGISDPEILSAIASHTTGKPAMSMLDKIIYIADYIEPRRYKASNLAEVRQIAYEDLDEALYRIMQDTLEYLSGRGIFIDSMTSRAFAYCQAQRESGKK